MCFECIIDPVRFTGAWDWRCAAMHAPLCNWLHGCSKLGVNCCYAWARWDDLEGGCLTETLVGVGLREPHAAMYDVLHAPCLACHVVLLVA